MLLASCRDLDRNPAPTRFALNSQYLPGSVLCSRCVGSELWPGQAACLPSSAGLGKGGGREGIQILCPKLGGHQSALCCGLVESGVLHSGRRIQASPGFRIAGWRGKGLSPKWEPLWSGGDTAAPNSWDSAGWDNYRWYWHHGQPNVSPVAVIELANLASIGLPLLAAEL